jgi:xanthine dehydrogenase molybdopterin-binding subunit B
MNKRVGGGFGGKITQSVPIAAAVAVAAKVMKRPVRMQLDRNTDMIMTGKRHPYQNEYQVCQSASRDVSGVDRLAKMVESGQRLSSVPRDEDRRPPPRVTRARAPRQVGFDDAGKISALRMTFYAEGGYNHDASLGCMDMCMMWADSAYRFEVAMGRP